MLSLNNKISAQQQDALSKNYEAVDANKPVVCLLPGRLRKIGGTMTYLERRKPAEMTASQCEIRGGEYTLYDRANYENALAVWREAADQGDATAQVYVGEIYEKGWLGAPDYATAAQWYAKAAAQDDRRAQRRLAYFYENGLGVDKSQSQALSLWRTALDLNEELILASQVEAAKSKAQQQIDALLAQLEQQNVRTGRLQSNLEDVQFELASQAQAIEKERKTTGTLERELAQVKQSTGDPARVRALEQQLAASLARVQEQSIAMELLDADSAAQMAQVAASMRRSEVRERQLADAQNALLNESSRGDALLVQLQEKDQTLNALKTDLVLAETQLQQSRNNQQQLAARVASGQFEQTKDASAELAKELQLAKQDVANRENALRMLKQETNQQRSTFEQALAKSELREADLNAALQTSKVEKEKLAQSLTNFTTKLAHMEDDLTETRYALADKEAMTQSLREQVDALDDSEEEHRRALSGKIGAQEKQIAGLKSERDKLSADWNDIARERDEVRSSLASQVSETSWLDVELESANSKLSLTRDELRAAEMALAEANYSKQRLAASMVRLEEDLAVSRERGRTDRNLLEDQLRKTRTMLANAGTGIADLRRETSRLESDYEFYGERQQGRMLKMRGLETTTPAIIKSPKKAKNKPYRAVIIANYEYDFLPDLSSPPFDANELKRTLETAYGFDVEVLINLNRSEMYRALAQVREFGAKDSVLLYYAGHGKMDDYGDGFWLPVDYRTSQPLTDAISSSDLTQTMNQSQAKHLMMIADSCYSGALVHNGDPVIRKSAPALLKYWMANKSRTVLSSGGLKPVLDDGPGTHSVFGSALLQALGESGGAISGEMLHAQVYDTVRMQAAQLGYLDQKPQFSALEDAGHENGQFVFLRP